MNYNNIRGVKGSKRGKRGYLPQVHSRKGRSGELEDLIWGMAGWKLHAPEGNKIRSGADGMTDTLFEYDHILMRSEYRTPDIHSHIALHLIVGLGGGLHCMGTVMPALIRNG